MKKLIAFVSVLLAVAICFASCGEQPPVETWEPLESVTETEKIVVKETDYSEKTFAFDEVSKYYKTLGRTELAGTEFYMDQGTSGFEVNLDCEGDIKAEFVSAGRVKIVIDGNATNHFLVNGAGQYTVAEGLEKGKHTLRIVNEKGSKFSAKSLTVCGELRTAYEADFYIEFIGDSVTAGSGLYNGSENDATAMFAYVAAELINADYTTFAKGGMGLCYSANKSNVVLNQYMIHSTSRSSTKQYTPTRKPDLVVINLGTNDNYQWYVGTYLADGSTGTAKNNNSTSGFYNYDDFDEAFDELLNTIYTLYNDTEIPILFVFGCMKNNSYTVGTDRMEKLIAEYAADGYDIKQVYLTTDRSGASSHPAPAGARQQGEELANFILEEYQ